MQTVKNDTKLALPKLYHDFLKDFVFAVIEDKPADLIDYAAEYFYNLNSDDNLKNRYTMMKSGNNKIESDEDDIDEPPPVIKSHGRRQAVAAPSYDPNQEDEDEVIFHEKTPEQIEQLKNDVKSILIFKSVDSGQLTVLLNAMFERKVEEGETVIQQGDDGDNFYIIHQGKFDIFVKNGDENKLVMQLDGKGSFGELALLYNCPRKATIIAKSPGKLWCLDQSVFRRIVVTAAAKKRRLFEELLENVPILSELTAYERMNLADGLDTQKFNDGDCIIRQGDKADNMFFIMEGSVRVTIKDQSNNNAKEKEVVRQNDGDYFGELALVTKKPRAANVYAVGPVTLAVLDAGAFERLLGPCVDIMKRNFDSYSKARKSLGIDN